MKRERMGKRIKFEEALETEFRWPKDGDDPFLQANDWDKNARVAGDGLDRLLRMTIGYKSAADLMVTASDKCGAERDCLVFPIIFNYRQFIELELKYLIAAYGKIVGIDAIWNTHDLAKLWSKFSKILEMYGNPDPDNADPIVERIIAEFSKADPQSYSYRYPVDRKGEPIPIAYDELDLNWLANVMKAVENYFCGCDGFLDELKNAGQ